MADLDAVALGLLAVAGLTTLALAALARGRRRARTVRANCVAGAPRPWTRTTTMELEE